MHNVNLTFPTGQFWYVLCTMHFSALQYWYCSTDIQLNSIRVVYIIERGGLRCVPCDDGLSAQTNIIPEFSLDAVYYCHWHRAHGKTFQTPAMGIDLCNTCVCVCVPRQFRISDVRSLSCDTKMTD
jgi:hypothetical protein